MLPCFNTQLACPPFIIFFFFFVGETITVLFLHRDQQGILLQNFEQNCWFLPGNTIYLPFGGTKILH